MNELPKHWHSTLQGLSYWIAYKRQYFSRHLLPEGAIVAELTQLLSANIETGMKIECERMYKSFGYKEFGQGRMDIAIGKITDTEKAKAKKGKRRSTIDELHEMVEVKRYEGDKKKLFKDMEKLALVSDENNEVRKFLVVVGQNKLPDLFFTDKHKVRTGNVYDGENEVEAHPRSGKKAYSTKKDGVKGTFSVIIEII